jgi:predicted nucleotidyltransferase
LEPVVSTDYSIPDLDQKLADGLRASGVPGIVCAYLFGSHARGMPHRESDVDVGVLLHRALYPDAGPRFDVRVRLSSELLAAVHREVDVVILNDAPPMLGRHILTEGRRILCLDPTADHDYVVYALIRAADVEPWYRRYARIKLEAIRR